MTLRAGTVLAGMLLSLPAYGSTERPLVVSTLPYVSGEEQEAIFRLLSDHLSRELGQEVVFQVGDSYTDVVRGLTEGSVDVAFLGAAAYIKARRTGCVRAILRSVRKGKSTYRGVIVVPRNSSIGSLKDLRGKRFAFVDTGSTAGYHYPRALLRQAGIDPDTDLSAIMAGGHHKVVAMVASGRAEAGASYEGAQSSQVDPTLLRVLAYTDPIAGDPVVVRAGLGRRLIKALRSALIELATDNNARPFFTHAEIDSFEPAIDADYDGVADLMRRSP